MTTQLTSGHTDLVCPDVDCEDATSCSVCGARMCAEHSTEYVSHGPSIHHEGDCSWECQDCQDGRAYDAGADRGRF